jgi:antitoxin (DNA-binding transcriptional repressor) of toxin-antitoxin stability system
LACPELPDYPKPMKVSAQYAEEHFADVASAAARGEEVEIEVYGQPLLVLVQRHGAVAFKCTTPRVLGSGRGRIVVPDLGRVEGNGQELFVDCLA